MYSLDNSVRCRSIRRLTVGSDWQMLPRSSAFLDFMQPVSIWEWLKGSKEVVHTNLQESQLFVLLDYTHSYSSIFVETFCGNILDFQIYNTFYNYTHTKVVTIFT